MTLNDLFGLNPKPKEEIVEARLVRYYKRLRNNIFSKYIAINKEDVFKNNKKYFYYVDNCTSKKDSLGNIKVYCKKTRIGKATEAIKLPTEGIKMAQTW